MRHERTAPVRAVTAAAIAVLAVAVMPSPVSATPPPNPGDEEIDSSRAEVREAAERVGSLTNEVASARAELTEAQMELSATYDEASQAREAERAANATAEEAENKLVGARAAAEAADEEFQAAREQLDEFAAASFRQGSTVGSVSAYLGSGSREELLAREQLLGAAGGSRLDAQETVREARLAKGNSEAEARAAMEEAERARKEAERAAEQAMRTYQRALSAEQEAEERTEMLLSRHEELKEEHAQAQRELDELRGQRQRHEEWQAEREQQASQQQAAQGSQGSQNSGPSAGATNPGGVVAPTTGRITSTFGPRGGSIHYGLDIANIIGTPIVSAMDGTVISSGPARGFGLWVRVRHDNGTITVYGHNDRNLVHVGQRVRAGQQIATVGNRGQSTGPHLHFEVHVNGTPIDPLVWLRGHGVRI
ncbi:peptidoglycan DD-metalloendopeptidase family protein [Haloechinothrix sp. LS1_15]|uniref:peptidoglycan DD-metalloendopeptidase family protein n=1 Tax=Haloechinothrix sp. LS1_15 TaxID=2652248 RepID=UPI00294AAD64|nr:peptidoglycan DD-metalloendopeptidase family protein [Haloechinothrix sp. LS1_15]